MLMNDIIEAVRKTALELCQRAGLKAGHFVIVGCSTSEIAGCDVGTNSDAEIGAAVFRALNDVFSERGIWLAAQCCEHLNRAVIIEREASSGREIVNAIPIIEAGGAFATAAYAGFHDPVAIACIQADAGLDIGGTLIGMHLKRVVVPVRLEASSVGKTFVIAARTRPMYVGGARAKYDESLI